ncbi:MAG: hypothetical protein AB7P03_12865 [Kofleriaceae bacterium]
MREQDLMAVAMVMAVFGAVSCVAPDDEAIDELGEFGDEGDDLGDGDDDEGLGTIESAITDANRREFQVYSKLMIQSTAGDDRLPPVGSPLVLPAWYAFINFTPVDGTPVNSLDGASEKTTKYRVYSKITLKTHCDPFGSMWVPAIDSANAVVKPGLEQFGLYGIANPVAKRITLSSDMKTRSLSYVMSGHPNPTFETIGFTPVTLTERKRKDIFLKARVDVYCTAAGRPMAVFGAMTGSQYPTKHGWIYDGSTQQSRIYANERDLRDLWTLPAIPSP